MFNNNVSEMEIKNRDNAVCRSFLQTEQSITPAVLENCDDLVFFRIKGMSDFWLSKDIQDFDSIMGDLVNGIVKYNSTFCYALISTGSEITVNIGISKPLSNALETSLNASYPFISMEKINTLTNSLNNIGIYGGVISGTPTKKTSGENPVYQIERLSKGMFGENWAYVVIAKGLSPLQVNISHNKLLSELNEVSKVLKQSVSGGTFGNQIVEAQNFYYQNYFDNVQKLEERLNKGVSRGMWRSCSYYMADNEISNNKLKNLLTAIYSGEESKPEATKCIDIRDFNNIVNNLVMVSDISPIVNYHPAGIWEEQNGFKADCFKFRYQNVISSDELATYCQIPRQEMPGYYIDNYVEFDTAERRSNGNFIIGNIANGNKLIENKYSVDLNDLTRHALIIGITGGGKTNTSKSLLSELWKNHNKPFLVIESAKREYWELANLNGFQEMILFTLGAEGVNSIPYRINPFEVVGDVGLQTHIDYLLSTFKASFELYPPMPYILETAVYEVYEDRGWDILNNVNILGRKDYPNLEDLYYKVEVIIDRLGYHKEVQSNVKAALQARISSLRVGGKGAMLDTDKSVPIEILLDKPAVLELEDIGDDDVKAFVIGIVMVQLYEYRRSRLGKSEGLEHLLLIEEAHRLLKNVSQGGGESANPRGKAVEFFCNLLAEIRSYGQGIMIADQIPTKLAPDTLKNTNLKIVHRTVMEEDRQAVGKAMNMTEEQIQYLCTLKRGYAAIYAEGDNRPKLVRMPLITNVSQLSRGEVIQNIKHSVQNILGQYSKPNNGGTACAYCLEKCTNKTYIDHLLESTGVTEEHVVHWIEVLQKNNFTAEYFEKMIKHIEEKVFQISLSDEQKICLINFILEKTDLKEAYKREKLILYIKHRCKK